MEREKLTVLIVEDQKINRQILSGILRLEYDVAEAENGEDAFSVLERQPGISAILLDIVMPVMDGYTFLEKFRTSPFSSLPVIAITGEKNTDSEQKALDLGAWDFVSKPYQPATLMTRLKNVIVRSQFFLLSQMKHAYEHDPLTGLYNRNFFFSETRKLLDRCPGIRFALIRFDIDHFQTYNSFWGEEEGDRLLRFIADRLREISAQYEPCTYARINADTFCLCAPYSGEEDVRRAALAESDKLAAYNREYRLVPSFGVYVIGSPEEKIQKMYELATLAAKDCKGRYFACVGFYKPEMSEKVLQNQWIVNEMQHALDAGQFEVFLQPKYNLRTELPYGAEALVRWRHPEKGLLSPGVFIPVLEQNGFIGRVDYFMWESVCRLLRGWIAAGHDPGPISVNVSRMNLYNPNLAQSLKTLVKKYDVPPRLLHLEVTESAYMDSPEIMEKTVAALQREGFSVLMDDFGSGYSSLNTLKDIHVDVLKIDLKFLSGDSNGERSRSILASTIRMAGWLNMPVIMEGVETLQQVEFLRSIGCNYAQGFYYAKPMPVAEYEQLIRNIRQTPTQACSDNIGPVENILWAAEPGSELLFNSMEQPAAVYEVENGRAHILRVNRSFNAEFGGTDLAAEAAERRCLTAETAKALASAFRGTAETRKKSVCTFRIRQDGGSGAEIRMTLKYWGYSETASIVFAQFARTSGTGSD